MSREEKLTGGNVSAVYRSGDTVRRELKPESARIHKLLSHLEKKGFRHSPAFLGIDEKGREILSFIEGEAGNYPLKEYMWSDEVLSGIAKMLRHYHDAVSDFPIDDGWEPIDHTPEPFEVLCHNDFAIYNIIFNKQHPVGIIDFDVAGPGPRRWDIAYTLYTCVPLSRVRYSETGDAMHYDRERDAARIKERVKRFFESYGIDFGLEDLQMAIRRLEAICQTIHRKAREGDPAFQKMIEEGHVEHYQKDIAFVRENLNDWIEEA
ncbi:MULTISPECIES: phosphotransferase [Rossellomorea]|uniref:phosphotransferase n=1 Tax=Rossellomorea TaxID=2837508 RepID=UPI001CCF3CC1|nr:MULTISPECIES: phosphotransferase [Rossellomorea]MCA0149531.1 phosphotransferase [Rossellomorea vietnamensis]UTE78619.1 phosphotransferase [Rossellomorea sp. KS-H15a]WGG46667.1 phosphotransferase [Rossellomorea sp. DA94]